jgi:hypothetical protein
MIDLIYIQPSGSTDSRDMAILVILKDLTMISLYLNRFFDRFFAFYASLCRKVRATS